MADGVMVYDLRHGVRLTVRNTSARLSIRDIADFLAEAMRHFKHHRDVLKTGPYTLGPWGGTAKKGRKVLGTMQLDVSGATLTAALWTDAVIGGYVQADTLEQIAEALPQYRAGAQQSGGWLQQVVGLLDQRDGALLALRVMLDRGTT